MDKYIESTGVRRIDDEIDDRGKVAVLVNAARVFLLVHTDSEQPDRIGPLAGQRSGKAVGFVLVLLNDSQDLGPCRFGNVGIVVDDAGYGTAGYPSQLGNIFAAHKGSPLSYKRAFITLL